MIRYATLMCTRVLHAKVVTQDLLADSVGGVEALLISEVLQQELVDLESLALVQLTPEREPGPLT